PPRPAGDQDRRRHADLRRPARGNRRLVHLHGLAPGPLGQHLRTPHLTPRPRLRQPAARRLTPPRPARLRSAPRTQRPRSLATGHTSHFPRAWGGPTLLRVTTPLPGGVVTRNHDFRVIHRLKAAMAEGWPGGSGWGRGRAAELDLAQPASVPGRRRLSTA